VKQFSNMGSRLSLTSAVLRMRSGLSTVPEDGYVSISSTDPPFSIKLRLGPVPAQSSGGIGGWNSTERPQRKAASEWTGTPLESLVVQVLLDGLAGDSQVEEEIEFLKLLALPASSISGTKDDEPPVLTLAGMVPHGRKRWVLNDIEWDAEDVIWNDLRRVRQFAVLTFLEYSPARPIRVQRPAQKAKKASKTRTVVSKKNDTVASIVKRELRPKTGASLKSYISKVKKLNSIRSSKTALQQGRKIKLPAQGGK